MYMIGQVTALRDERDDASPSCTARSRDGSSELLERAAQRPQARPEPPGAAAGGRRDRRARLHPARSAPDVASFWANILDKVDAIGEVPAERWDWRSMYDPDPAARDKVYSRWGGFIDPVALDPMALGLPPKSLALDRAVPAAGAAVRAGGARATPATRRGRSTASAPR